MIRARRIFPWGRSYAPIDQDAPGKPQEGRPVQRHTRREISLGGWVDRRIAEHSQGVARPGKEAVAETLLEVSRGNEQRRQFVGSNGALRIETVFRRPARRVPGERLDAE